jgi:hypothetical protein
MYIYKYLYIYIHIFICKINKGIPLQKQSGSLIKGRMLTLNPQIMYIQTYYSYKHIFMS